MNSYIDALKAKYNMSNVDCVRLKDLLNGFKELGYDQGYSEGYNDGLLHEQADSFAKVNETLDKIENYVRKSF